jgi:hypothetical protein
VFTVVGEKGFPDDALALVRGDEQGDARAEAVALRQQLVQADHDDARHEELQDDQDGVPGAELAHVAVDAGHDVRHGLTDGDQNAEELLRAVTASKRSRGHERVSASRSTLEKIRRAEKRAPRPGFVIGGKSVRSSHWVTGMPRSDRRDAASGSRRPYRRGQGGAA